MKRNILLRIGLVFCFLVITTSTNGSKTGIYLGPKGGFFTMETKNAIDILSIGGSIGYSLPLKNKFFKLALEGETNYGVFGGDYVSGHPGNRVRIRTFGGYGVIRSIPSNEIYIKGKIGVTHETVNKRESDVETIYKEVGPSFGAGVGFEASDFVNVEVEFATTNSDMKFFSINFHLLF
jgi:hypothetical protein